MGWWQGDAVTRFSIRWIQELNNGEGWWQGDSVTSFSIRRIQWLNKGYRHPQSDAICEAQHGIQF